MNMHSYNCMSSDSTEAKKISGISSLLKLVGEESKLSILCSLRQNAHCVCEIVECTKLSQSLISHHLKDLKDFDIVSDEKNGQFVFYSLTDKGRGVIDMLLQL
jgi:ArsR family transcriptional regulator, arsenate/arsenite/antimonite-responsive transcriptional repressor